MLLSDILCTALWLKKIHLPQRDSKVFTKGHKGFPGRLNMENTSEDVSNKRPESEQKNNSGAYTIDEN